MQEQPGVPATSAGGGMLARRGGRWLAMMALLMSVAAASFAGGFATRHYLAPLTIEERRVAQGLSPELDGSLASVQTPTFLPINVDIEYDEDEPTLGPKGAPVTIVEYSDFECPFCRLFHQETFDRLLDRYPGSIRYVAVDFPLHSIHPQAQRAAEAAGCAHDQGGYWPYQAQLFDTVDNWSRSPEPDLIFGQIAEGIGLDRSRFDDCVASERFSAEVNDDLQQGIGYGVNSTPTFFINGRMVVGAQPLDTFVSLIEQALADGE